MTAKELKASILDLAVRGKLVPQDPNDEPASVLLEKIRAEKQKLIKAGKIKKEKNTSEIYIASDGRPYEKFADGSETCIEDEVPFELPAGWSWIRHNSYLNIEGGAQPPKSKFITQPKAGYVRLYQIRDYGKNPVPVYIQEGDAVKRTTKGDILLARYGASLGKVFWAEDGAYNVAMAKASPFAWSIDAFEKKFLFWIYQSRLYRDCIFTISRSAQVGFNRQDLDRLIIPVPPLAEQKRIAARIDELLPKVAEYERVEKQLSDFETAFPAFLKKSILRSATEGKLVPQDPKDEPVEKLLERIAEERKALIKAGKLKRDKYESVIFRGSDRLTYETRDGETVCIEDELPFNIPCSWAWVRLGSVSNYGQCTGTDDIPKGSWMLDLEDIERGGRLLIKNRTRESKSTKHVFMKGQVLYSKLRTYLQKVLVADEDGYCTSEIIPITFFGAINPNFATFVLNSPYFVDYTQECCCGVKMPRLTTGDARAAYFPLPPLAEQLRIVAEVERLEAQVAQLQ